MKRTLEKTFEVSLSLLQFVNDWWIVDLLLIFIAAISEQQKVGDAALEVNCFLRLTGSVQGSFEIANEPDIVEDDWVLNGVKIAN